MSSSSSSCSFRRHFPRRICWLSMVFADQGPDNLSILQLSTAQRTRFASGLFYLFVFFCAPPPPPYCHLYFPPVFPSVVITRKVLCLHLKLYAIFPESVNACRGFKVLKNVNLLSLLMLHWVFLFYFPLAANAAAVWVEFSFVCLLVGWQFESNASGITWHSLLHIKLDGWWKVAVRPYETAESLDWGGQ